MNKPAVCFKCQTYGRLTELDQECSHSMPNPKYPSMPKVKIPDNFKQVDRGEA